MQSIDWDRSDYDPYARTKKFCEHMIRQLAAGYAQDNFPSQHRARVTAVMPQTTQFDMVQGVCVSRRTAGAAVPSE